MTFSLTGCIIDGKGHTLMDVLRLAAVFTFIHFCTNVGYPNER